MDFDEIKPYTGSPSGTPFFILKKSRKLSYFDRFNSIKRFQIYPKTGTIKNENSISRGGFCKHEDYDQ
ncbi:hypothetical protein J6TS1_51090 [Siminovitchia terrae]|uniref:Uncharacterized protein n=1 Tax=Siminovitchia terrae TaxID=1914933 RepID=A0ABQ4L5L6_SIMTE|nr:hypothetical protein J6TS1_51090 [Siminovitchia terrae]